MATTDLIRKIRYLKANPRLAELVPQSDMIVLIGSLLEGFQVLQKAIEENKLKGDKGEPGYTPRPGVDYAPLAAFDKALAGFSAQYADLADRIEQKLATVKSGDAGKDAEITDELKAELAAAAADLIELPDFAKLLTMEPEAIRNSLELLQNDSRLSIDAIAGLREALGNVRGLQESIGAVVARRLGQIRDVKIEGITDGQTIVYQASTKTFIPGTPSGGGGAFTLLAPIEAVDGSRTNFTFAQQPRAIINNGTTLLEASTLDESYTRSGNAITMPFAPTVPSQFRAIV